MALFGGSKKPVAPAIPPMQPSVKLIKGANVAKQVITYSRGQGGKGDKAQFGLGKACVPSSVITRILQDVEDMPERRKANHFYAKMMLHYNDFLTALDAEDMDYVEALETMRGLKPSKTGGAGLRASRVVITAEALVKGICKRFKGEPKEMVERFAALVATPEFQKEAVDMITAYRKAHGVTAMGHVKTSNRIANPQALAALKAYRKHRK